MLRNLNLRRWFRSVAYFDYQATCPLDYRVHDAMIPYMCQHFGNPHSKTHQYGWHTSTAVEAARDQVASLINASPKEIFFTSGASESNNAIVKGLAGFYGKERRHIITTQIEHKSTLEVCRLLESNGYRVTYLPVLKNGLVDPSLLQQAIDNSQEAVLCVSVILVNNEIGVKQDIKEIGRICKERGVFLHTDAGQAIGKIPIDVNEMNIDLLSISGHKIYGPKGIGAMFVRRKPRVRLTPLLNGGGQERGYRSGTLPPFLVVGMGKACEIAKRQMNNDQRHIQKLFNKIVTKARGIPGVRLNGDQHERYHGNINLTFPGVDGEKLVMALQNFALSAGSACSSESFDPSYVLKAIGLSDEEVFSSLRIGIGRFTTEEEVEEFLAALSERIGLLRREQKVQMM